MQKTILKRALSLVVCLAVLIAGMPLAVLTANAETPANVVVDDFESGEVKWIRDDSTEIDAERIVAQSTTNTNKVFNPLFKEDTALGSVGAYTYAGETPDTKLLSVSGQVNATAAHSIVLIYYYKDANNWRGISFGTGSQWLRFSGRETIADSSVIQSNFITYDSFASHGGTFEANSRLLGATIDFTITYAEDGTASMVLSRTTDDKEEKSTAIPLNVGAVNNLATTNANHSITGPSSDATSISFSSIQADIAQNGGSFAFGNALKNATWVDNIVMTYEKTPEQAAEDFKTTHAAILAKTIETVTADDLDDINAAIADYDVLTNDAKALLTEESELLSAMAEKIVAAQFDVSSFTDDFSGENYWTQVGDGAEGGISNERFQPGAPTDIANGKASVHIHKYWPDRNLKSVTGTMYRTYRTGVTVYYYKDANNWRGIYYQGVTTAGNWHLRYIMKETDPNDPNKVYYYYADANDKLSWMSHATTGTHLNFEFDYLSDSSITYTATSLNNGTVIGSKSMDVAGAFAANVARLKVSEDGGATFAAATEAYTFSAITDAKSSKFGFGYSLDNGSWFDDITISFEEAPQDLADKFLEKYAEILSKDETSVTTEDKETITSLLMH